MSSAAFIGVDWGTTNRRAWLLDAQGEVLAQHRDEQGSLASRGRFAASLQELLERWPAARGVPVVMAGMVGSSFGWQEVPYVSAAVPLRELARHLESVADAPPGERWFIVPGMCWRGAGGRVDVMRGEETQLLGEAELAPADGWTVLPGTHSKWVLQQGGAVAVLRTYLTSELFAALRGHGTLAPLMAVPGADHADAAFDAGVQALGDEELSHALFGARARVMGGGAAASETADFVSGLLIAAEWRDALRDAPHAGPGARDPVRLVGEPALAARHARCARYFECRTQTLDPEAVQLAAWRCFHRKLSETS